MTTIHEDAAGATVRQQVAQIWNDVLPEAARRPEATFFELNGESISAVRLVSRVEDEIGVMLDVAAVFEEDPNLESFIRQVQAGAEQAA